MAGTNEGFQPTLSPTLSRQKGEGLFISKKAAVAHDELANSRQKGEGLFYLPREGA
jgi:hypothetical protein